MISSITRSLKPKVLLFNASPRTSKNTMHLLNEVKRGSESVGAEAKIVDLFKLKFKGCSSCLECKKKGRPGGCFAKDDLSKYLKEVYDCNGIAIGSPIYLSNLASSFYPLFERLIYSNKTYTPSRRIKFGKKINTGLVLTMGVDKNTYEKNYKPILQHNINILSETLGPCTVVANVKQELTPNTDPYDMAGMDLKSIHKWIEENDPIAVKQAYDLGIKLASKI